MNVIADFAQLRTTRKGRAGERIAQEYLSGLGYKVYRPAFGGSHEVDFLVYRKDLVFACEVKTYSKPDGMNASGIDSQDWKTYQRINDLFPVFILWIDPGERKAYGNFVAKLQGSDRQRGEKIFFDRCVMVELFAMTAEQVTQVAQGDGK